MNSISWWTLPDYSGLTPIQISIYVLFATMGWLARVSVKEGFLLLPSWDGKRLRLNIIGEWITAVLVGVLADHNILVVTCAAAGAPTIVRTVVDAVPTAVRKLLKTEESCGS